MSVEASKSCLISRPIIHLGDSLGMVKAAWLDPMLPETRNGKRNGKRERYEKRCLEVSHIRNEEREKNHIKGEQYKQSINHKPAMFLLMKL